MSFPSVKIIIRKSGTGEGSGVEIDGVRIPKTHAVSFQHKIGKPTSVTVELWAGEIVADVDGALVTITPDLVRAALAEQGLCDVSEMGNEFRLFETIGDLEVLASRVADILGRRQQLAMKGRL